MANPVSQANSDTQTRVLAIIRQLLDELGSQHALRQLSADSQLDRELGLGSLERVELLERLEKAFSTRLPDQTYLDARTPADLASMLAKGKGSATGSSQSSVFQRMAGLFPGILQAA